MKTGDCRYSFGTAVSALPIPELTPFRLTRQMVSALSPHPAAALLQRPMQAVLGALRAGHDVLEVQMLTCVNTMCKKPELQSPRAGLVDTQNKMYKPEL
jgi:phosphatidylinositol kinase/protein kinase (PI-3  family)